MLTISYGADNPPEFNYEIPDDESAVPTPNKETDKTSKKNAQKVSKKSTKVKSKGVRKAKHIKKAAKKKASQLKARPIAHDVQEQIRILNEKFDRLESGKTSMATPASSITEGEQDRTGFIHLSGTNTAIKFGGYVKADAIYDANQFTGDSSNLPNLRLKGLDTDTRRSNVFTAHAKQTRLSIASETNNAHGQISAYLEGDFFGGSTEGSTGSFSRSDTSSLNSYNFRMRHAYGSYCHDKHHRVDIGQIWTLFYDRESSGTTIEFNGSETTAQIRRPQIRYTHFRDNWKFAVSIESGATEYLDITPSFVGTMNADGTANLTAGSPSASYNSSQYRRAQNSFLGGISGDGNQALPDLVGQISYKKKNAGHFTIGGMVRELRIKKLGNGINDPTFSGKKYGYGVTLTGRSYVHEKSNVFAQISCGKGIGTYIFALDGYGAAIDASRGQMQSQFACGFLIGAEYYWSEKWRSNIIFGLARANVSDIIPGGKVGVKGLDSSNNIVNLTNTGYSITNMTRQLYFNLLWNPAEKFGIGIEYAYFRRDTINKYYGYGNRFQFGAIYRL